MKVAAALAKIPWKNLFRLLPGFIGIAGKLAARSAEKKQADAVQQFEKRLQDTEKTTKLLASQMKLLLRIAAAALVIAVAALIIALAR